MASVDRLPPAVEKYLRIMDGVDVTDVPYVTKKRVDANFEKWGKALNHFLVYPDLFVDLMVPKRSHFDLFFSQRLVLRCMARYRQGYYTYTRAFSKSFLAFLSQHIKCMFVPRTKTFVSAGQKKQAAQIAREKIIDDLWVRFPLLANEMQKFRRAGQLRNAFKDSDESVEFRFNNGSILDVVGGKMRGGRRTSGIFEEVIEMDPIYTNEVIIPLLNTVRTNKMGQVNPHEPQGAKIFVTTAGYQSTYAYDKLKETLCFMMLEPTKYMVMGGSYRIPYMHGLLTEETLREILSSPSYDNESVDREYRSIWSGAAAGAAFDAHTVDNMRRIKRAEYRAREDGDPNTFYAIGVDLAKDGSANTAAVVYKGKFGEYQCTYQAINVFKIESTDYEVVANTLKKTVIQYNARLLTYDANGIGASLREWLNKPTRDTDGAMLEGLGIINPPPKSETTVIKYRDPTRNICYELKTGGQKASEVHRVFFSKVGSGNVRFLIKAHHALQSFQTIKKFAMGSRAYKDLIMRPYLCTDLLEEELKNLDIRNSDTVTNIMVIDRRDKKVEKDFFSAAEYGIYGALQQIEAPHYKAKREGERTVRALGFVSGSSKGTRSTVGSQPRRSPRRSYTKIRRGR